MKLFAPLFILFPCILLAQSADVAIDKDLQRIAFGSCSRQELTDDQLWDEVNESNPDLWIWLGDNIYGDSEDMGVMRAKYDLQKSHLGYQELLANTAIIGIWDDHDYGVNDGGSEYAKKDDSKVELFRFLDIDEKHPAWNRTGAYQSYTYRGTGGNIKVILLDTRYFRDSLRWNNPGTPQKESIVNPTGDILGETQWRWLTEQLRDPTIDLYLVGSGIQVIADQHQWEKWSNFPMAQNRLMELIRTEVDVPLVLLTGDRHLSEVSRMQLADHPFAIWDITSSSLNSPSGIAEEANRYREGDFISEPNFALMEIQWNINYPTLKLSYIGAKSIVFAKYEIDFK